MIRTQIQLEPAQYERLKALAARRSTSVAHLVREGVDHVLTVDHSDAAWERLLSTSGIGRAGDGVTDVSAQHDRYLADVFG